MRYFLLFLLLPWALIATINVEDGCDLPIFSPQLQERSVRKCILDNGLKVYMISDPDTKMSGAALAVDVGSFDDPYDQQGMAHFVEHMLFMGTKKYPQEAGYHQYLKQYGGTENAFTANDRTAYLFSILNEGFIEAIDRFSQFFIEPLFLESCLEREAVAVHQEYTRNIGLDFWRAYHVKKEIANPQHPFHHFSIGTKEILQKIPRANIIQWYQQHYSSDRMHLILYAPLSLDELEAIAHTYFLAIPKTTVVERSIPTSIFLPQAQKNIVHIYPLNQTNTLDIEWEIPRDCLKYRLGRPEKVVSYILGHQGENTLHDLLVQKGLAQGIQCRDWIFGDQGLFTVSIDLTQQGRACYEEVIALVFQALRTYQQEGIDARIVHGLQDRVKLQYAYQQRTNLFDYLMDQISEIADESLQTFPRNSLMPIEYDPSGIDTLLQALNFSSAHFFLISPDPLQTQEVPIVSREESWMKVPYEIGILSNSTVQACNAVKTLQQIQLPQDNPFMPQQLAPYSVTNNDLNISAKLISDTAQGVLYFRHDDYFGVPKFQWTFHIYAPTVATDRVQGSVLLNLWQQSIEEVLRACLYEARSAGLQAECIPEMYGCKIVFKGFSEKAPMLMKHYFTACKQLEPSLAQFETIKQKLQQLYYNAANASPLSQGQAYVEKILVKDTVTLEEKLELLPKIRYQDLILFAKQLFAEGYITSTVYGSFQEDQALKIWEENLEILGMKAYPKKLMRKKMVAHLSMQEPVCLKKKTHLPGHALILSLEYPYFSLETRAAQQVLGLALLEPFFSELRTRQQTAYLVKNAEQDIEKHLFLFFYIQSTSHTPQELLARFELFLEHTDRFLQTVVTPAQFEMFKVAAMSQFDKNKENLEATATFIDKIVYEYDADFTVPYQRQQALADLSYERFLEESHRVLQRNNKRRLAISITGKIPTQESFEYKSAYSASKICRKLIYESKDVFTEQRS